MPLTEVDQLRNDLEGQFNRLQASHDEMMEKFDLSVKANNKVGTDIHELVILINGNPKDPKDTGLLGRYYELAEKTRKNEEFKTKLVIWVTAGYPIMTFVGAILYRWFTGGK